MLACMHGGCSADTTHAGYLRLHACMIDAPPTPRACDLPCARYIERPLLVRCRKFHVRAYVLCVGSLSVYAYSEALALFAGKPYDK